MNNNNETLGLKIESVNPSNKATNVNIWRGIEITFSSDVDPSTLAKNIVVFEDTNNIYKNIDSLKDYSQFNVVSGTISYEDRVMTFTPNEYFTVNTKYILIVNNKILDITGNMLLQKTVVVFTTEEEASYPPCKFIEPKYGLITGTVPKFKWEDQNSGSYEFQISKGNTFELLFFSKFVTENEITPEINFEEGIYYARVKSEKGEWSDPHQIFIKPITDAIVAKEDTPETLNFQDFLDNLKEPLEILEVFPKDNSGNISLKTNIIYIKIKGEIDKNLINFDDCYVYGETINEEHEEYTHGLVDGTWSVIYDKQQDVTYIVFDPTDPNIPEYTVTFIYKNNKEFTTYEINVKENELITIPDEVNSILNTISDTFNNINFKSLDILNEDFESILANIIEYAENNIDEEPEVEEQIPEEEQEPYENEEESEEEISPLDLDNEEDSEESDEILNENDGSNDSNNNEEDSEDNNESDKNDDEDDSDLSEKREEDSEDDTDNTESDDSDNENNDNEESSDETKNEDSEPEIPEIIIPNDYMNNNEVLNSIPVLKLFTKEELIHTTCKKNLYLLINYWFTIPEPVEDEEDIEQEEEKEETLDDIINNIVNDNTEE